MNVGALGDIHGRFDAARRIMERHREVPFWLCVGDVADDDGNYEPLPAPLYFIKGNNENFDLLESAHKGLTHTDTVWVRASCPDHKPAQGLTHTDAKPAQGLTHLPENLHFIPNGTLVTIGGLRVAGLGGTFAPTMYEVAAADLPHPTKGSRKATELADRRRHFVREEVEACRAMRDVHLFLSHEAPRPFRVNRGIDAGKTPVNEVLASMKPRLHLFGHHHRFVEGEFQGVRSVALDLAEKSYLLIDANTLEYQHLSS